MKFKRFRWLLLATLCSLVRAGDTAATGEPALVTIDAADGSGELEMDFGSGTATATNGVIVRYLGTTVRARTVRLVRTDSEIEVEADGQVEVESDQAGRGQAWRGEGARYNLTRGTFSARDFRIGQRPFFASATEVSGGGTNGIYSAGEGFITTDDLAEPGHRVRASRIEIEPGRRIEARNAVLYAGSIPVFYWPVYRRSLKSHNHFWTVTPGFRSVFGAFSLNRYHWNVSTNLAMTFDADVRQRRGLAGGPGIAYDLGRFGIGEARLYLAQDEDPFRTALMIPVREDRRLFSFRHIYTNASGLTVKGRVEEQNDALVYRDFFEGEFRRDPQPRTFGEINQAWRNWSLNLLVQPQVNPFFQTIERLPDIRLTGLRQELGESPLYYEGESSFAHLRFRPGMLGGFDYGGIRADSYHQVTLPVNWFGWLNVAPRVGGRVTYYGEPDGLDAINRDETRALFNTGVEMTFKASRTWASKRSRLFDLEGLRHIIEPGLNYVFVPDPALNPGNLPQYDFEFITPRLLPIDFPDYNAIDSIDSHNVIRWSLRNRLQTRRAGQPEDVLNWALYTDWRLNPRPGQTTFPELFSDMDFAPRRWALFTSQVRYDINQSFWREANHRLTLQPGERWAISFGHRYLRTDFNSYGLGNNLLYTSLHYRLDENWGFRTVHQFEARDGVLEEQHYTVYRDLRSITAALGVRLRENRQGVDDWAIVLTFQLKAFPQFKLGQDQDVPDRLFGG
jgi:lipopolysaccharide assembly outer membrane protein LptD (OstA)